MAKNKAKPSSILNSSKKKRFRNFSIKLAFVIICHLIFYCIYLDGKIRSKMDGQIWQLPAEVYSRIESIRLSDKLSFEQVKQRLLENNYRQTTMIAVPGDFKVENDTIVLLRGAFPFPTAPEAQRVFRLRFQNNQLAVIEDLVNTFPK